MTVIGRTVALYLLVALAIWAVPLEADELYRYQPGTHQGGQLGYISGLPVLVLEGTPEQMGRQQAAFTAQAAREIVEHPRNLLAKVGREERWPELLAASRPLKAQIPDDHLRELEAFAQAAEMDLDLLIAVNTMVDCYRDGFACSSLVVEAQRSATGGPLFGRNLDFFTRGTLQKYSLVAIYRPEGKYAFASIGFPGMLGCFSGMNEAGLALAVHEVFFSKDGATMFDPEGTPYTFCFRRILEECSTVEEAEELMRSFPRTTLLSLVLCDRHKAAVLEMTPKNLMTRGAEDGICACTNHFRSKPLATFALGGRYFRLMRSRKLDTISLDDVAKKLDEVNLGRLTLQTMIFEPHPLLLHLAIGPCPTSALPLQRLELAELFRQGLP